MSTLTGWNLAAMVHETIVFKGDTDKSAHFIGGMILGMALATIHPEYAQAALHLSQGAYHEEKPDGEPIEAGVERFIRAVPIELPDGELPQNANWEIKHG